MPVNVTRYVLERVREDNPEATPEELVALQAEALAAAGLIAGE